MVFCIEKILLEQTQKKLKRKRSPHPPEKGSKQREMRDLIQQKCMLQNSQSGR